MENGLVNALSIIKTKFGIETFADSKRMNGLLADLLPSSSKDRKIVIRIIDEGIMQELLENRNERGFGRLKDYLYDEEYMRPERAEYYLDVFATVLDYDRKKEEPLKKSESGVDVESKTTGKGADKGNQTGDTDDANNGKITKSMITGILFGAALICICVLVFLSRGDSKKTSVTINEGVDSRSSSWNGAKAPGELEIESSSKTDSAKLSSEPASAIESTVTQTPEPTATPQPTPVPVEIITVIGGIQAPASDFMFPKSSERVLTWDELNTMLSDNREKMHSASQMAINEMFARYGYTFKSSTSTAREAKSYFESLDWYHSAQSYCDATDWETVRVQYMNDIERENIERINSWQRENGVYY